MATRTSVPLEPETGTELCRVKLEGGSLGGYRSDILTENLSERENSMVKCLRCEGIMKDASISNNGEQLCVLCRRKDELVNPHAEFIRNTILSLKCACPLFKRGCEWLGRLESVENHLTTCGHVYESCQLLCGVVTTRDEMGRHVREECSHREEACLHCSRVHKVCEMVEHVKVCGKVEVLCELGCGTRVRRESILFHRESECSGESVVCPYEKYRCEVVRLKRRELKQHLEENRSLHIELRLIAMEEKFENSVKEIEILKRQNESSESKTRIEIEKRMALEENRCLHTELKLNAMEQKFENSIEIIKFFEKRIESLENEMGMKNNEIESLKEDVQEEAALKRLMEKKLLANVSFREKDYDRAIHLYTEILEVSPDIPALRPDLSKIYYNRAVTYDKLKGDFTTKIIEDCTQAIIIDPKYCKARIRRAKTHESNGDALSCLKDWTIVGLLDPQLAEKEPSYQRVDSIVRDKAIIIANEEMKTHVVLLPSKVAVEDFLHLFNDRELYSSETDLIDLYSKDRGIEVLQGALQLEPFWQAVSLFTNRRYHRIVDLATQAIDTGCRVFHPYALIMRSTFYIILFKNQEAIEDVDMVLKYTEISPQLRISALLRKACALEALEKYDSAQAHFLQALQIDPNNHSIYLVRSKFYSSDEHPDYDKALKDINKCLELRPSNNLSGRCYYALLRYKLASTSQSVADLEKAKRHLKETMKQFPNRSEPISLYVQIMIDVQELKEASQYLEKAIAMDPDNGLFHVYRAQCNMSMKGASLENFGMVDNPHMKEAMKLALEELEYAIKIDGQCGVAMEVLSTMYSQIGELDRALEYLDMAIKYTRTKQEMISLHTFRLMLSYQPEITAEIQSVGLAPSAMQNFMSRQY